MKKLDGTLLALGTVGLVAVAGAFRARGSRDTSSHVSPQPSALREPGDRRSHFNLNTGGYTLDVYRDGGWRMERNTDPAVLLERAYFRYSPSGHRDYLASFEPSEALGGKWAGRRGVHAWIYGKPNFSLPSSSEGWRKARYSDGRPRDADPMRSGAGTPACFVDLETGACLPNDRSIDVWLASAPNTPDASGRVGLKYRNGRVPMLKPVMYWRAR
jgi:hypothetical protein